MFPVRCPQAAGSVKNAGFALVPLNEIRSLNVTSLWVEVWMRDEWAVQAEVTGSGQAVVRRRQCVGCTPVSRVYDVNVCGRRATRQNIFHV